MSYEIEITVGDRTFHYGSVAAFRRDMETRAIRIKALWTNAYRDGISPQRRTRLMSMANAERQRLNDINVEALLQARKAYESYM